MDKPITMIVEDTKNNIAKVVNESGLPPFILETIMKDLYNEIAQLSMRAASEEKQKYNDSLLSKDESESNNIHKEE